MWNKKTNRPKDWVNPHDTKASSRKLNTLANIYEAGADAVIPEAKAEGRRELIEELKEKGNYEKPSGENRLVFGIPDDLWQQLLQELNQDSRGVIGASDVD